MNSKKGKGTNSKPSKVPRSNEYVDSTKIEKSFLALQNVCKLSKEEIETGPLFSNEKATIYLHVTPKIMRKTGIPTKILLEHPLSYKRAVCFIAKHMDKPAQGGKIMQILKKVGIDGKIKPIPLSLVQLAAKEKNLEALDELAMLYDTHFVVENLNMSEVANALNRQRKRVVMVDLQPGPGLYEEGFRIGLATTLVCTTATGKSIDLKVAHVGMSAAQAVENVRTALVQLISKGFPDGFSSLDSIRLKSGDRDADAYDLYLDGDLPQKNLKEEQQKQKVEKKAASTSLLKKKEQEQKLKETTIPEIPRGSLQLAAGLSSLKLLVAWTGAARAAEPRFTDEQATFYLRLKPINKVSLNLGDLQTITLIHPLSYKRRVCLIVPWDAPAVGAPDDPEDVKLKETVQEIGVKGFVQIVHHDNIPRLKHDLRELAALTDSVIGDEKLFERCKPLRQVLTECGKALASVDLDCAEGREEAVEAALRRSPIQVKRGEYVVKVGNTGLTHGQMSENLASALAELLTLPHFPNTLKRFEFIQLENGQGVGVPVFLSEKQVTKPVEQIEELSNESAEEHDTKSQHPNVVVTRWDYRRKREGSDSRDSQNRQKQAKFGR